MPKNTIPLATLPQKTRIAAMAAWCGRDAGPLDTLTRFQATLVIAGLKELQDRMDAGMIAGFAEIPARAGNPF